LCEAHRHRDKDDEENETQSGSRVTAAVIAAHRVGSNTVAEAEEDDDPERERNGCRGNPGLPAHGRSRGL